MSAEILHTSKEKVVRATALTTVVVTASSLGAIVVREVSRRRVERLRLEALEQSAGDGDYILTPEAVQSR